MRKSCRTGMVRSTPRFTTVREFNVPRLGRCPPRLACQSPPYDSMLERHGHTDAKPDPETPHQANDDDNDLAP